MYTRFGDIHWVYPHWVWFYYRNSFDTLDIHIGYLEYTYYKRIG